MSAHPDRKPTPTDAPPCASCPSSRMALVGYTCPHLTGFHHLRRQHDTCALPPDVRREKVRALGCFDGRRAHRLAAHFGLPRDTCVLD